MKTIYDAVKEVCKQKGVSINQLEKDLNFAKGSICKWYIIEPSVYRVKAVADYLGVSIYELLPEGDKE